MVESYCSKLTGKRPITLLKYSHATEVCLRIYSGTTAKTYFRVFSNKTTIFYKVFCDFFPIEVSFHGHWWFTMTAGEGRGCSLFLSEHLDIYLQLYTSETTISYFLSMFHWQFFVTSIFSVSLKFGGCYVTGQWGEFEKNSTTFCLLKLFGFFIVFHKFCLAKVVFLSFSFLFW